MNKEKMIEAAARCDSDYQQLLFIEPFITTPPDYLHDYNAIHRLVQGLSVTEREVFTESLRIIVDADWTVLSDGDQFNMISATCPQMLEAYLKAKGVWEDE